MTPIEGVPDCIDLFWLPLGAGDASRCVRWNGRLYEAAVARVDRRQVLDLYHSALQVRSAGQLFAIEMAPLWGAPAAERGVVCEGPVGLRLLGRSRFFRYEVRRWPDGTIPDLVDAVGGPQRLSRDPAVARRLLDLVPRFPTYTWGRDEQRTGEMWNSNSLISWLLSGSGIDPRSVPLPDHGRAPGWFAGLVAASALSAAVAGRSAG